MFVKVQSPNPGLYRGPSYVPLPTAAQFATGGSKTGRSGLRDCKVPLELSPTCSGGTSRGACGLRWGLSCSSSALSSYIPTDSRLASLQALPLLNCLPSAIFTSAPPPRRPSALQPPSSPRSASLSNLDAGSSTLSGHSLSPPNVLILLINTEDF